MWSPLRRVGMAGCRRSGRGVRTMAEAGQVPVSAPGGKVLTEEHAALWLAVLELLAQLQRKTGVGRVELLRAIDAMMRASSTHDAADARRDVVAGGRGGASPAPAASSATLRQAPSPRWP